VSDAADWPPTRRQIADAIKVAAMNDEAWARQRAQKQRPGESMPDIEIVRLRARVLHYAADRILAQEAKRNDNVPHHG
jgi:hypothetical protein